mmetsp:Transcript_8068/g.25177  ORF Transcript_8068/g.25177 Transcript_8068/m.25177 type:complete len:207 (-) Transcript_8068:38-658(-)
MCPQQQRSVRLAPSMILCAPRLGPQRRSRPHQMTTTRRATTATNPRERRATVRRVARSPTTPTPRWRSPARRPSKRLRGGAPKALAYQGDVVKRAGDVALRVGAVVVEPPPHLKRRPTMAAFSVGWASRTHLHHIGQDSEDIRGWGRGKGGVSFAPQTPNVICSISFTSEHNNSSIAQKEGLPHMHAFCQDSSCACTVFKGAFAVC